MPTSTPNMHNPYLLTPEQERDVRQKQRENRKRLRVPRRPPWTREMKKEDLERSERDSFLEWRRGLAEYVRHRYLRNAL
jgi:large subunit GTPase 1